MKIFRTLESVHLEKPTACAIGMFDGVHLGHHMVLEQAIRAARIENLDSAVFTFANHPQSIVSQTPTPLLSTLDERLAEFNRMGFDVALVLDFTPQLRDIQAEDFVQTILLDTLHEKAVSVGYDHRFGKDRLGDGAFLKAAGERYGFQVEIVEPVRVGNQIISSTLIRKLLSYGDLNRANTLLGRPYTVTGKVISGVGRGKTIGFPTANMEIPSNRLIPAHGVYVGWVQMDDESIHRPAICNIGLAPTFGDQNQSRVEVHLLDFVGNLYEKAMTFHFLERLREERAFPSVTELVDQVKRDCQSARSLLESREVL